jgi:predicted MFS family arabinose efflux permease
VPAWQVLTPRLVPREELANAIALNGLQFNLARAIGPALGGVLMASTSATTLFAVNALSFLGVIVAVSRTPPTPRPAAHAADDGGWLAAAWRQTGEAFRFVFRSRGPLCVFLGLVVFSTLAGGTVLRMLPLFVSEVYGIQGQRGEAMYGVLLALMGLGAVGGALGLRFVPNWYPRHHFIPMAITGGGLSIVLFSTLTSLPLACAAMLIVGVFWIWAFNSSIAAMQLLVHDSMRGRVMAVMNMVVFGAAPLGTLGAAYLGEAIAGRRADGDPTGLAVQVGVGGLAAVLALAGPVMLTWRTPEVDGIQPGQPGYDRTPGLWRGITAAAHRPPRAVPLGADEAPGQELP